MSFNQVHNVSRRHFLVASGLSASFLAGCSILPPIPKRPNPSDEDALGWISLTTSGKWLLYSPRMEMGQNILSALREVAAIELGIPASAIDVRLPSTADMVRVKATVGSDSMRELCLPLARACHTLRAELLRRAQSRLAVADVANLGVQGDSVMAANGARVSLRELSVPAMTLKATEVSQNKLRFFTTKNPNSETKKPFAQLDAILRGQALYAGDVRLPGMVFAVVLRAPWADGALAPSRLKQWDEAAVRAVPGFLAIVQHPLLAGPALVATRIAALEPMRLAAAAKWSVPALSQPDPMRIVDVDTALAQGSLTKSKGSVKKPDAAWSVDMRLDIPLASHAFIEPRCAVVQPTADGGLEAWCGTQDLFYVRDVLARDHGLTLEAIKVHAMRIGGGFGGKTIATVEREAAIIAKQLSKPVKVQWSRADEFQAAFHRQPTSHRIQAQLDAQGKISDWRHTLSTSHVLFTNAVLPPWLQKITHILGDDGAARGQQPVYTFVRQQLDLQLTRLPVLTGPWRGLGAGPNVLAIEMAMDAAARVEKSDPFEFRLRHLVSGKVDDTSADTKRLAGCLLALKKLVATKPLTQNSKAKTASKNIVNTKILQAQGIACGSYKGMSYAAASAEVEVVLDTENQLQSIHLLKLWCTHDCGKMIDPNTVRAMVEGNLVWSIGMVLTEQLDAPRGTAQQTSFSAYKIPRMTDLCPIDIELIVSNEAPSGAGETAIVAGAGAIANAVTRALIQAGLSIPKRMPITAANASMT
jgi:isoquinoline 1-oxidoreductase subunit beta